MGDGRRRRDRDNWITTGYHQLTIQSDAMGSQANDIFTSKLDKIQSFLFILFPDPEILRKTAKNTENCLKTVCSGISLSNVDVYWVGSNL